MLLAETRKVRWQVFRKCGYKKVGGAIKYEQVATPQPLSIHVVPKRRSVIALAQIEVQR